MYEKCPSNLYEFMGRRCVQEDECKNYTITDKQSEDSLGGKRSEDAKVYFKPFKNKCLQECPLGYVVDDNNPHLCKRCDAKCPKICPGMTVDHVGAAQNYRGCTRINGSLEIHIQGGSNVIKELEENMNMIEQIDGYLKIARSFPLLCPSKIQELKKYADTADWDDRDVSPSSNGDRVACDVTNMNVTVQSLTPSVVRVKWESFHKQLYDERSLLGYVIYYREALYRNISIFEGRDACGTDAWTVRDVEVVEDSNNFIVHHITNLKPFTQYALYIRTYTTASGRQGAQSSIVYFKTQSDTPTPPVNAKARSTLPGEIVISWKQPKHPNGNVTYYIIEGIYEEDNPYFVNQRNYCLEPIAFPEYKKNIYDEDTKHVGFFDNVTSSSLDSAKKESAVPVQKIIAHLVVLMMRQNFKLFFLKISYTIKASNYSPDISRRRRHIAAQTSKEETTVKTTSDGFSVDPSAEPIEGDRYVNGSILQFKRLVYHHTFLVVSNLKHFTEYTVEKEDRNVISLADEFGINLESISNCRNSCPRVQQWSYTGNSGGTDVYCPKGEKKQMTNSRKIRNRLLNFGYHGLPLPGSCTNVMYMCYDQYSMCHQRLLIGNASFCGAGHTGTGNNRNGVHVLYRCKPI
ncbi:insulin-like peptide receptor [Caerostris extrusa]|uniref:receptor protein-tyrosine kinase n=1 Tax=Caerostris extrusa TaxID=172846 RepID=A0AAV4SY46_CAEEX|nr:insulin-like peptide receptor [Caerostris extrusa]